MIRRLILLLLIIASPSGAFAEELGYHQTLYDLDSVATRTLAIKFRLIDDARFSVTLTNKETGFERRHAFDGEGESDPAPYQLEFGYYCGTEVILLTVEHRWRHAFPMYGRVLDTIAFDESTFSFIDMTFGPVTDIALMDSSDPESADLDMQPKILVECLPAGSEVPLRFVENPVH